jgi:glycosyltransferase involved in cell wall biosynthesis
MRVAIDARLNAYRRGGIPEYTRQLLAALAPLSRSDTFITLQHREHLKPLVVAPNVRRRAVFTPPHHRFEQIALPAELLALRPDLLHCPDFVVPLRRPCPAVVTIHDLAFLHFPEILDDDARRYYGQVRASAHSAQAVIAVSKATRDDIVRLLDLPAERVDVVYEAAGPEFRPPGPDDETERIFGDHTLRDGEFALFVSTLEPRKNLPLLLRALKICRERRPEVGYTLAVAGARGWRYQAIFDAVREHELEEAALFLGPQSPEQLRWLYGHCRLYANPSRYEGFGLPVLEALACGAPSLVADTSSLPEIVGEAAPLLPTDDPEAWADAIEALWHDDARRAALSAAGPPQAARFSWRAAAEQTLAIYRRVARSRADAPAARELPAARGASGAQLAAQRLDETPVAVQPVGLAGLDDGDQAVLIAPDQAETLAGSVAGHALLTHANGSQADLADAVCPRCGGLQRAGTLEGVSWHADDAPAVGYAVQAWACARCGALDVRLGPALSEPDAQQPQTVEELAATMAGEPLAEGPQVEEAATDAAPPEEPQPQTVEELAATMAEETPAEGPQVEEVATDATPPEEPQPQTVEELAAIMSSEARAEGPQVEEVATDAAPPEEPQPQTVEELAATMAAAEPTAAAPTPKQRGRRASGASKPAVESAPKPPQKSRRSGRKGG